MIGTNLTFFAMILMGYAGMPRRYAGYSGITVGPIEMITLMHVLATIGAFVLLAGTGIWLVNMIQSYFEGPHVGPDPWNLDEDGLHSREWDWFDDRLETALADGGDGEVRTDGGRDE
jgi:cytochrome c oxidase subunit 1